MTPLGYLEVYKSMTILIQTEPSTPKAKLSFAESASGHFSNGTQLPHLQMPNIGNAQGSHTPYVLTEGSCCIHDHSADATYSHLKT